MSAQPNITLFYAPDNASLVIRLVLEAIGLQYNTTLVDRSEQQQRSADYLKLNPNGLIPTCVINGAVMFETGAVAMYLADAYSTPQTRLHCVLDNERSDYLTWLFFLSNNIHTQLRSLFYPEYYVSGDNTVVSEHRTLCAGRLLKSLQVINDANSAATSVYFFSDRPSVIDIYLAVCCRWMQLFPVKTAPHLDVSAFPRIHSVLDHLNQEQFVATACHEEGIVSPYFIQPLYANPTEGSAT